MEYTKTIPIGIKNTIEFINEVHEKLDLPLTNKEESVSYTHLTLPTTR